MHESIADTGLEPPGTENGLREWLKREIIGESFLLFNDSGRFKSTMAVVVVVVVVATAVVVSLIKKIIIIIAAVTT